MVLKRRSFLQLGLAGAALVGLPRCGRGAGNLVLVGARGGWDPTFALDPKDPADADGPSLYASGAADDRDTVETFSGIPVVCNPVRRPAVADFFGAFADRCVVVNGIEVGSIAHVECVRRMWTGGDGSAASDSPDIAALAGGPLHPGAVVGCLDLGPGVLSGSLASTVVRIGRTGQIANLLVPTQGFAGDEDAIARWRARRAGNSRLHTLTIPDSDADAATRAAGLPLALEGLALDPTDPVATAVAALSTGTCGSVYVDTQQHWDSHTDNSVQDTCWEALFVLLTSLGQGLQRRGLLDSTLVLVISEMGRPPARNSAGGKDHWPATSALLFGGGIRGARVLGGTDASLAPLDTGDGPITPASLLAGVLDHLGGDAATAFVGTSPLGLD